MKCYNLYFISLLKNDDLFKRTELVWSNRKEMLNLKSHERKCVEGLVSDLFPLCASPTFFDGFVFSYTIPHIGKEFDLLKISDHGVLNIELKSSNIGKASIREQLLKNKYYLSHLSKHVTLFTYVHKGNLYFTLNEQDELVRCSKHEVALALSFFASEYIKDLDPLFAACRYLISPVNEADRFISGNYFLTQHQQYAKNKILSKPEESNSAIAITGSVGTGKTLLLYDLCKTYATSGKRCLFIYPGALKEGHYVLNYGIPNLTIQSVFDETENNREYYDCIFVDEANKLPKKLFSELLLKTKENGRTLFLTYDPDGYLSLQEKEAGICAAIENNKDIKKIRLTNTIRTNESILSFSKMLFEKKKPDLPLQNKNIQVLYLPEKLLDTSLSHYKEQGYAIFQCMTEGVDFKNTFSFHESEKGVVVVGKHYGYNPRGQLSCFGFSKNEEQILLARLKRALLRVREQLVLVVSDQKLYSQLLTYFEGASK